jgi:transaldolase
MPRLVRLYEEQGQSPWLDNLTRSSLWDGTMADLIARGVRGVTANPTIVAKAIESSDAYDPQFHALLGAGHSLEDAYWHLVVADVCDALGMLRPTHDAAGGADGFVSIEVAPGLAHDTLTTMKAARELHRRIGEPNLLVKIPATSAGVPAIEAMVAEGRSINVTLIFSLPRYRQVLEAYLSGLEALAGHSSDLSTVHGVASFFVSRVDTEVDRRLEAIGTPEVLALRGKAAVAQTKLAYQLFRQVSSGPRWEALAAKGARLQRPLWASTSTKNPAYSPTLNVDELIGPDTVNTLAQASIDALQTHDGLRPGTVTERVEEAGAALAALPAAGVDFDDVTDTLEREGVASFAASFHDALDTLSKKARELR